MTFVTVEGLDGSGKTTVIEAITERYPDSVTTSEPSELWTGKQVRRCLTDETLDPLTDFYFFMGDRVHHINEIVREHDESGGLVVSDRYADSTRAYQPVALGQTEYFRNQTAAKVFVESTMRPWNYEPDLTLYIDISVDTAIKRSDGEEKYEKRQFLESVKQNYESLVERKDRIVRINGEQPKEQVKREAIGLIDVPEPDAI